MEQRSATGGDHFVEDTYLAPQFGVLEFLRRLREDQLSVLVPELFGRNLVSFNHLFFAWLLVCGGKQRKRRVRPLPGRL